MLHKFPSGRMPRPERLRPAEGVAWSEVSPTAPSFVRRASSGRRKLGVQYEDRVHLHFHCGLGPMQVYWPGPWIRFICRDEGKARWCQPDGLHFDLEKGILTIVEMKYTHTAESWWWIQKLYLPVVRSLFPQKLWTFRRCEVVHSFDPGIRFPEPVQHVSRLEELDPKKFGVIILKEMCYE